MKQIFYGALTAFAALALALSPLGALPANAASVKLPAGCTSYESATAKSASGIRFLKCTDFPSSTDLRGYGIFDETGKHVLGAVCTPDGKTLAITCPAG